MEGPFSGDQGRRVLVLNSGQPQQCSHCFEIESKCPATGNGKICKDELNTPRAKMSAYMNSLKISKGYASLKSKYLESQSKNFPLLGGDTVPPGMNDMDTMDAVQNDHFPSNPMVERD